MEKLTDENFATEIKAKGGIAVVDFSAGWCGPCRSLAPHFEAMSKEFEGRARFYKCDIEEAEETAAELGVMTVPMVIIFREGEVADQHLGFARGSDKEKIAEKVRVVVGDK